MPRIYTTTLPHSISAIRFLHSRFHIGAHPRDKSKKTFEVSSTSLRSKFGQSALLGEGVLIGTKPTLNTPRQSRPEHKHECLADFSSSCTYLAPRHQNYAHYYRRQRIMRVPPARLTEDPKPLPNFYICTRQAEQPRQSVQYLRANPVY